MADRDRTVQVPAWAVEQLLAAVDLTQFVASIGLPTSTDPTDLQAAVDELSRAIDPNAQVDVDLLAWADLRDSIFHLTERRRRWHPANEGAFQTILPIVHGQYAFFNLDLARPEVALPSLVAVAAVAEYSRQATETGAIAAEAHDWAVSACDVIRHVIADSAPAEVKG